MKSAVDWAESWAIALGLGVAKTPVATGLAEVIRAAQLDALREALDMVMANEGADVGGIGDLIVELEREGAPGKGDEGT